MSYSNGRGIGKAGLSMSGAADIARREELAARGFLREAFALADPSLLPALRGEASIFDATIAAWRERGIARVPYVFTEAIERVTHDTAIRSVVEALLGTDRWVVWGPNVVREVPGAAARWHVDLESRHWRSVTVAVGLGGCAAHASACFLPGTHRLSRSPFSRTDRDDDRTWRRARRGLPDTPPPEPIEGFGDGRFYVFDARTWHRASRARTADRLILFLQFQHADAERVPWMLDYRRHRWSPEPAPYRARSGVTPGSTVARLPVRERVLELLGRLLPR